MICCFFILSMCRVVRWFQKKNKKKFTSTFYTSKSFAIYVYEMMILHMGIVLYIVTYKN